MGDKRYLIYGVKACPYCVLAINYLTNLNQEVIFFNLEADLEFLDEAKRFYGSSTVPIILENNNSSGSINFIGGYSDLCATQVEG